MATGAPNVITTQNPAVSATTDATYNALHVSE